MVNPCTCTESAATVTTKPLPLPSIMVVAAPSSDCSVRVLVMTTFSV